MALRLPPRIVSVLCMALSAPPGLASNHTGIDSESTLLDLSLDELLQVTVTSVSKKAQRLDETAAAVFVINVDDIRRSGATNVPEALRLAPGVQVAAVGHNKWAVSIRGFNSRVANKLLVLVDGRAIYSPAFSGVFWEHNDIPLENIERIEVIRGPGASIWGTNAVNGVINIITRSARDSQGGLLSLSAGDELRGAGLARYGWALDEQTHARLHAQAKSVDPGHPVAGGAEWDKWESKQAGFRLDATRGRDTYSLQGNLSDYRSGDRITAFTVAFPYVAILNSDGDGKSAHLLGRWERQTDDGIHSLQAYLDHADNDNGLVRYRNDTFDLEYQRQIDGETHDLVWGLGFRANRDRPFDTPHLFTADNGKDSKLFSAFIQDDIALSPNRWRLTLGSRVEHNSHTGFEVQPNLRLLWTPNKEDSVWAALSRAVRTPSRGETASTVISLPPQPPLIPISTAMVGDPDMNAEKLEALDLGWRRQWAPTLTSEVAAFYYRYADLRAPFLIPGPLFLGTDPYQPLKLSNAIGAEAHGLELSMDWLPLPHWRLQANTSLFHIRGRDALYGATDTEFIGSTPGHQISLRSSLDITPRLQWDTWLRHVGRLRGGTSSIDDSVPAYTSLDMRLAWKPNRDLSIALVGQNLLDPTHLEKIAVDVLSDPVEIERAVYVKVDWKF